MLIIFNVDDTLKYGLGNPENPTYEIQRTKFGREKRNDLVNKQSSKVPGPGQ